MTKSVLKSSLFCATVGILALSACAQTNNPTSNNPDQYLSQYHWNLQSAVNQNNQPITAFYADQQQPKFTLNFDKHIFHLYYFSFWISIFFQEKIRQLRFSQQDDK